VRSYGGFRMLERIPADEQAHADKFPYRWQDGWRDQEVVLLQNLGDLGFLGTPVRPRKISSRLTHSLAERAQFVHGAHRHELTLLIIPIRSHMRSAISRIWVERKIAAPRSASAQDVLDQTG